MEKFIEGNAAKRAQEISLETMLMKLMQLYSMHDPQGAMLWEGAEFSEVKENRQGDMPPKKQKQNVQPVPMDIESLLRQNANNPRKQKGY